VGLFFWIKPGVYKALQLPILFVKSRITFKTKPLQLHRVFLRCIFTAQVFWEFYYICKEPHCNEKPPPFFSCHSFFFCQCAFPIPAPYPHRIPRKSAVTRFDTTQLLHRRACRRTHEYSNRSALSILSVEDLQFTVGTFYPNPTSALLRIDTQDAKAPLQLRISNTSGQVFLETQVTNGQEIDVQDLAQGVYFLQLYDSSTQRQNTYKLIKK
jgi:hypothetical protein